MSQTHMSIGNCVNNLDRKTESVKDITNSSDEVTGDYCYILMDGHVNGDVVSGSDPVYYNCENRNSSRKNYENMNIKYVNMEASAKITTDNYDYLHAV